MSVALSQSCSNTTARWQTRTCKATFTAPTAPGSLIIAICVSAGGGYVPHYISDGNFTLLKTYSVGDLQLTIWYKENCYSLYSLQVTAADDRSLQVRLLEYTGCSQSGALDSFSFQATDQYNYTDTGPTNTPAQSDSLILGVLANQYASTTQYGYSGNLTKLYESLSPEYSWAGGNEDWERSRCTWHHATPQQILQWRLQGILSATRAWISFIICFKGGSLGPAKLSSTQNKKSTGVGCRGSLTAFGPLQAGVLTAQNSMVKVGTAEARIGPFNYQYRLGGWNGLLIGSGCDFRVESIDGLEGWEMRTSDSDLPRGDGALRGIDLQSARQAQFKINYNGSQADIETAVDLLYRTLIPQANSDWQLIYRHPGRPLRVLNCRPITVTRQMSIDQLIVHNQTFILRAADPRHYSATTNSVTIPVTVVHDSPISVNVNNLGDSPAYPVITVKVPLTTPQVTRIELVNSTADTVFDVRTVVGSGSTLVGDMQSRATGTPASIVTVDGQSKYGAWQFPRTTFRLNPGVNQVYVRTEPQNTPVTVTLQYRDTWSG